MPRGTSKVKARSTESRMLTTRQLNRALLARQLLLERSTMSATQAIEHLVGLQAQAPNPPYFALYARLAKFAPNDLGELLTNRKVVRIALMRSTIHLVTARDCLALRPLLQSVQERNLNSGVARRGHLAGIEMEQVLADASSLLAEKPRTTSELGALLAARRPGRDPESLGYACRNLLPLVQLPPRGVWGKGGGPIVTTAELWLGKPLDTRGTIEALVFRYLAAFGPASVSDFQMWSGLTAMKSQFESLRGKLEVLHDENRKELFDISGAPRPDADVPAPVRFLGEYDNLILSHADRSRVVPVVHRPHLVSRNGQVPGTILIDGFVNGMWRIVRTGKSASLEIRAFIKLSKSQRDEIEREGRKLLTFAAEKFTTHNVTVLDAGR